MPYTIYVGGERVDRTTTEEDKTNIQRVLSIMDKGYCYTVMKDAERTIGQAEHVLEYLVSISFIPTISDVEIIKDRLRNAGVTGYALATCDDEECLNEVDYEDFVL